MSDNALPQNIPVQSGLKERINAVLAKQSPEALRSAFNLAKRNRCDYVLLDLGLPLFKAPGDAIEVKHQPHYAMGRDTGDTDVWYNIAPQQVQYGAGVLESGSFGKAHNGMLINQAFGLLADKEKIDVCSLYFVSAFGLRGYQNMSALMKLRGVLDDSNLKAFISVAAEVPPEGTGLPYCGQAVLAVCRDNAEEHALFNLGDELLRAGSCPAAVRGYAKPMAGQVLSLPAV